MKKCQHQLINIIAFYLSSHCAQHELRCSRRLGCCLCFFGKTTQFSPFRTTSKQLHSLARNNANLGNRAFSITTNYEVMSSPRYTISNQSFHFSFGVSIAVFLVFPKMHMGSATDKEALTRRGSIVWGNRGIAYATAYL